MANFRYQKMSYPENLFYDLNITLSENKELRQAQIAGLEFLIKKLPEKVQYVIRGMYVDKKYKKEIANELGNASNHVSCLYREAISVLSSSYAKNILMNGLVAGSNSLISLDTKIHDLYKVELSTRAVNCLYRWCNKNMKEPTLRSIVEFITEYEYWYEDIRNCGIETAIEVEEFLINKNLVKSAKFERQLRIHKSMVK